jgi:hypothetical protein
MFAMGVYVLFGAFFAATESTWPVFMPPQLDVFCLAFRLFGKEAGALTGAIFLGIVGFFLVTLPLIVLVQMRSTNQCGSAEEPPRIGQ